jgi:C1A family cysteine protease
MNYNLNFFLLICFLTFSTIVFAQGGKKELNPDFLQSINSDDQDGGGAIPFPIHLGYDAYTSKNTTELPASFDLRGLGVLPPVKFQSSGGCWAYSSMSTVESRMLVLGQGLYDLSDNNLKYCHGFFDSRSTNGNAWMTTAYFARQSGPLLEAQDPHPGGTSLPGVDCPVGEAPAFFVRDSRYPPNDMNTIKQLVMDIGSVWSLIYYSDTYFNDTDDTYYYEGTHAVNHVLNIVGWDDDKVTAGGTGAWICQNTYGSGWGEGGFVYVSYFDAQFLIYNAYFPTFDTYYDQTRVLLYDELGNYGSYGYDSESETGYALVKYELTEDLVIDKIGTYAMAYGTTIEIDIYNSFNEVTGVLSGLIGSVSPKVTEHPGLYTYSLDSQISLETSDVFYVKVKYITPSYIYPIPIEYYIDTYSDPYIESDIAWLSETGENGSWGKIGANTSEPYDPCVNIYGVDRNFVTIWDGSSWDNGTPNSSLYVIIDGNYTLTADMECTNLTVNSGKTLNIGVNTGVTVHGSFLNNGIVNILSDTDGSGSLITKSAVNNHGTINMERSVSKDAWHYISVPIPDLTANFFLNDYLQYWQESDTTWYEITNPLTDLEIGKGYALWTSEDKTYTFTGTPNSGNQTTPIYFTNTSDDPFGHEGANLMGNPYPSSIDWSGLYETYGAVSYWDGTQYASWNNDGGINGGTENIPPGQGFFIVTDADGSFELSDNNRTHNGTETFYKKEKNLTNELLLSANSLSFSDEVLISFREDAEEGFEKRYDAYKFLSGNNAIPEIYTISNGVKLSIDRRAESNWVQLGFSCGLQGQYSISLKDADGITGVAIEDTKNKSMHDLMTGAYKFNWDLNDSEKRFILHLNSTSVDNVPQDETICYYLDGVLYISNEDKYSEFDLVSIFDLSGRLIYQQEMDTDKINNIPFKSTHGAYILHISGKDRKLVRKIIM